MSSKNYVQDLCIKIVQTDGIRKKQVREARAKRESLTDTLKSTNLSHMPKGGTGINDPTGKIYDQIEYLETFISEQERRIEAVEQAAQNIGRQYDEKIRNEMIDGILLNLAAGGGLPFSEIPYPFAKDHFYETRKQFLRDVGIELYLINRL
ncbi:MAG: hypothetical protein PHE79_09585 [Eubacteriales bacterium]|nr:hypothetical protein [Eubacteriales bacterium]